MGFLAQAGQGVARAFAGSDLSAAGLANRSIQMGSLATGLNVAGNLAEGIAGYQANRFAAGVARQNAQAELEAGNYAGVMSKLRYGALANEQVASSASRGVSVDSGATQNLVSSTKEIGAMDALALRYNAARGAYAQNAQASLLDKAAGGALARGFIGAGTSLISGASALGDKWLAYQREFGPTIGGGSSPANLTPDLAYNIADTGGIGG